MLPAGEDFLDVVKRPLSIDGFLTAMGCALPAAIPMLPFRNWISSAAVAAYYFVIVDHIGRSRDGFPGASDATDDLDALKSAIFRGLCCWVAAMIPLLLYLFAFGGTLLELLASPGTGLLLLLLPLLYLPAVILAVVITQSWFAAFWPIAWVQIVSRAPARYAILVALYVGFGIAWWITTLVMANALGGIPFIGPLLIGTAANLLLFMQACVIGGFLRRNAEVLGYA
jgi:hypothetical protein